MLDVLVDLHELIIRGDIETRTLFEERLNDLLLGVGLHRIVALNPRQVLFERPVVLPEYVVVNNK
jgi:hypothetical protein